MENKVIRKGERMKKKEFEIIYSKAKFLFVTTLLKKELRV